MSYGSDERPKELDRIARELKPIQLPPLPENPLVSVLTANYNYGRFIGEAIESVQRQTYTNWEMIICDDGSTDNSCEVVERYMANDSRIKLIRKENGGVASALNAAYAQSRGEIIALLDADDAFRPRKLEKVVEALRRSLGAGLCVHYVQPILDASGARGARVPWVLASGWLAPEALRKGTAVQGMPPASGLSLRREVTDRLFPLPADLPRLLDAYIARGSVFMTKVAAINETLAVYRLHASNTSVRPTYASASRHVDDSKRLFEALRRFVEERYGPTVSRAICLEDDPGFLELLLGRYVLSRAPDSDGVGDVLKRLPDSPRKWMWRFILAAPPWLRVPAVREIWGMTPLKRFVRPLFHPLRLK